MSITQLTQINILCACTPSSVPKTESPGRPSLGVHYPTLARTYLRHQFLEHKVPY